MTQPELITHINYLAKEIKRLDAAMRKAEISERNYSPKNEARSWAYSEQFDKAKTELKLIVKELI